MRRFLGTGLFAAVGIVLMAGMAFAGTARVNYGTNDTPIIVALEGMGANLAVPLEGVRTDAAGNNNALGFALTQSLTSANLIRVTFIGAAFNNGNYNICAVNSAGANTIIAQGSPGLGLTTFPFQLGVNADVATIGVDATNVIWLTNAGCDAAGGNDFNIVLAASAGASTPTVAIEAVTAGNIVVDPSSTATAANITPEYTAVLTSRALTIDYLGTAGGSNDGFLFTAAGGVLGQNVAANGTALNINMIGVNVSTMAPAVNATFGLTTTAVMNMDANTNWQAVTNVWAGTSDTPGANNSNVVAAPNGAVALNIPAAAFPGTPIALGGTNVISLLNQIAGNVTLEPRTITGTYDINIAGVGAQDHPAVAVTWQTWTPNGYQAFVPHMRFSDTQLTFLRLVNNNARAAEVVATLTTPDGTQYANVDLGTIAGNETLTFSAGAIATAAGMPGTTGNYALNLTVRTNNANVFANCYFNLLSGGVWTTRDATVYDSPKGATYGLK
jgi:hypothetical protein